MFRRACAEWLQQLTIIVTSNFRESSVTNRLHFCSAPYIPVIYERRITACQGLSQDTVHLCTMRAIATPLFGAPCMYLTFEGYIASFLHSPYSILRKLTSINRRIAHHKIVKNREGIIKMYFVDTATWYEVAWQLLVSFFYLLWR
jgi:hypothetical protein